MRRCDWEDSKLLHTDVPGLPQKIPNYRNCGKSCPVLPGWLSHDHCSFFPCFGAYPGQGFSFCRLFAALRQKRCAAVAARVVCGIFLFADYLVHDLSGMIVHGLSSVDIEVVCGFIAGVTKSLLNGFSIYIVGNHRCSTAVAKVV